MKNQSIRYRWINQSNNCYAVDQWTNQQIEKSVYQCTMNEWMDEEIDISVDEQINVPIDQQIGEKSRKRPIIKKVNQFISK